MSTNESNPLGSKYFIHKVEPMRIRGRAIDYRTGWAAGLLIPFFMLLTASLVFGLLVGLAALAYLVITGLFWFIFVWAKVRDGFNRPIISMWYRKQSYKKRNRNGDNYFASLEPEIGEVFGIKDYNRSPPEPPPEIGAIDYYPFPLNPDNPDDKGSIGGGAHDYRLNTDSASLWVGADSWLTQDPEEQVARFGGFQALLDHMARQGSLINRFTWQDVTMVGEHNPPKETARALAREEELRLEEVASYLKESAGMDKKSVQHWTTFNISVSRALTRTIANRMGGPERLLARQAVDFYKLVTGGGLGSTIGVKAAGVLTHNDRIIDNRLKTELFRGQWLHTVWERPDDVDHLLDGRLALPGSYDFESGIDYCVLGNTYYMSYYIEEFPAAGLPPDAFWSVVGVKVPKVVSVVFELLPPWMALQMQELKTTTALSSNVDLNRAGYRVKEKQRISAERAQALEAGLAESKGQLGRVRAYISVAGRSLEEVRSNAEVLEGSVTDVPFYLELLTHRQDEGVNAMLNVCRGLETTGLNMRLK
jgi:hypothetical protein